MGAPEIVRPGDRKQGQHAADAGAEQPGAQIAVGRRIDARHQPGRDRGDQAGGGERKADRPAARQEPHAIVAAAEASEKS